MNTIFNSIKNKKCFDVLKPFFDKPDLTFLLLLAFFCIYKYNSNKINN
jgi:hypothetical protein